MYFTYILKNKVDNQLYVGYTLDLQNRIKEHANGLVPVTKGRRPLKLVYYEACLNKDKAVRREKYFKTGFGRRFLMDRI